MLFRYCAYNEIQNRFFHTLFFDLGGVIFDRLIK